MRKSDFLPCAFHPVMRSIVRFVSMLCICSLSRKGDPIIETGNENHSVRKKRPSDMLGEQRQRLYRSTSAREEEESLTI